MERLPQDSDKMIFNIEKENDKKKQIKIIIRTLVILGNLIG